jgi:hypothetical protein
MRFLEKRAPKKALFWKKRTKKLKTYKNLGVLVFLLNSFSKKRAFSKKVQRSIR